MSSDVNNKLDFDRAAKLVQSLLRELPETISLDDLREHPGLAKLVLAADDLSSRVDFRALGWAKSQ